MDGTKLTIATDAMPVRVVEAVGTMLRRLQADERIRGSYWSSGVGTATSLFLADLAQLESVTTTVGRVRVRMLRGRGGISTLCHYEYRLSGPKPTLSVSQ